MNRKIFIYIASALYCVLAFIVIATELLCRQWELAIILLLLYFFIALSDWYRYKLKKTVVDYLIRVQKAENNVITISDMANRLLVSCTEAKRKKLLMYNCDHCPRKSDTCQKLVYEDRTECVEPIENFDL